MSPFPMQTLLHAEPAAIAEALARLELTEHQLLTAAMQGYLARANCTANHPPLFPSFVALSLIHISEPTRPY